MQKKYVLQALEFVFKGFFYAVKIYFTIYENPKVLTKSLALANVHVRDRNGKPGAMRHEW